MTKIVLRPKELPAKLNVSMATVNRLLAKGALPKIKLSQKCIGVLQTDIDAYLQKNRT